MMTTLSENTPSARAIQTNKILVVDDEPNHLKTIQRIFMKSAYQLVYAENGKQALTLLPQFEPDLVILDVRMPEMDGHQLCRHIKNDPPHRGTMVLMLSACADLPERLAGYRALADDYLTKPFDPDELRAKVRILLRLKNTQDELSALNHSLGKIVRMRTRELIKKDRQALLGTMLGGIVHNIRGPLTALQGSIEVADLLTRQILAKEEAAIGEIRETVEKISSLHQTVKRATGQADEMLTNLLTRSRDGAKSNRREMDLNAVIREELDFFNTDRVLGKSIHKKLLLHPHLPPLMGNHTDFSQLIYNLVKNAADAMVAAPVRELTISTDFDHGHIILAFRDTGSGIPPEDIGKIFDLYFTTKPSDHHAAAAPPSGSGIGLYTCDQIVRAYGGTISVESQPNQGTCFTIRIPHPSQAR